MKNDTQKTILSNIVLYGHDFTLEDKAPSGSKLVITKERLAEFAKNSAELGLDAAVVKLLKEVKKTLVVNSKKEHELAMKASIEGERMVPKHRVKNILLSLCSDVSEYLPSKIFNYNDLSLLFFLIFTSTEWQHSKNNFGLKKIGYTHAFLDKIGIISKKRDAIRLYFEEKIATQKLEDIKITGLTEKESGGLKLLSNESMLLGDVLSDMISDRWFTPTKKTYKILEKELTADEQRQLWIKLIKYLSQEFNEPLDKILI